jgi:hypothetical protein
MKFKELVDEVKEFSSEINLLLEENKKIYLFGAHIFSQSIYMEITSTNKKLLNVIDNASSKQGLRLYGTNMHVYSPEVLRDQENAIVALRASHYQDEVRNQLLSINAHLRIVE